MLNVKLIQAAKTKEKEYMIADGRTGLFLRILPTGAKYWIYRYTLPDGRRRKIALGQYPLLSLADARLKHSELVNLVHRGVDPTDPPPPPEQLKISELVDLYLASLFKLDDKTGKPHLSEKTINESKRTLTKYVVPLIGKRPAKEIRRPDAIAVVDKYTSTPGQARAVMKIARAMFTWALDREYVDFNPFVRVPAAVPSIKAQPKTRALSDEEIKHIWQSLLAEKDPRSLSTRRALLFILVTAQRPEEVTSSTYDEIVIGTKEKRKPLCKTCRRCGWWTIPWERIKTRNHRKVNHRVYLSPLALRIISDGSSGPIYPNAKASCLARHALSHYVDDHKCWGLQKWTPHDLRRTAATGLSRIGCPDEIIDAILNHAKTGIIGVYNQNKYDNEKEFWLTAWSEHLQTLLSQT